MPGACEGAGRALLFLGSPHGAPPTAVAPVAAASDIAECPGSGPNMDKDSGDGGNSRSNELGSVAEGQEGWREAGLRAKAT